MRIRLKKTPSSLERGGKKSRKNPEFVGKY
jgi:hypothetical protein